MAVLKDFTCDGCGAMARDVLAPAGPARPVCRCGTLMDVVYGRSLATDFLAPFAVEVNGTRYVVDSVQKARQIERIAEQQTRNGEGQPFIFRALSQDRSNQDENVFGPPPHPTFTTRNRRGQPFIGRIWRTHG
jgi:hypothetical protein